MSNILTVYLIPDETVTGLNTSLPSSQVALLRDAMPEIGAAFFLQTTGWHPGGDI